MHLFYPAAALYAAFFLPLSVAVMPPAWHAHELLFGYALAVVAGNQLGPARPRRIALLFALWLAARAAFLLAPEGRLALLANAAFALGLALQVAPRLLRAAKKMRNRVLPAVLVALCAAAIARSFGAGVLLGAVMLFAMLMLFMGGRILAPAIAGQLQRQGERLEARVQPRLEAALMIGAGVAAVASFAPEAHPLAAAASGAAGLLAAARMVRWRAWRLRGRPDLLCLGAGYAWLALGLLALAAAFALGRGLPEAIHVVTVGALGTLTFNVMASTWLLRARADPARSATIVRGTLLLAAATVARAAAALAPWPWLLVGALCWSAAFALLFALFVSRAARGPLPGSG